MFDVVGLFVEISSDQKFLTFFNGKNAMFLNTVHSEWVYPTL